MEVLLYIILNVLESCQILEPDDLSADRGEFGYEIITLSWSTVGGVLQWFDLCQVN
jgi:hypothetical protein